MHNRKITSTRSTKLKAQIVKQIKKRLDLLGYSPVALARKYQENFNLRLLGEWSYRLFSADQSGLGRRPALFRTGLRPLVSGP